MRSISRRLDPGMFERRARGVGGERRGGFALAGDVAAADAGALDDPFVGGVDDADKLIIVDAAGGKRGAGAGDDRSQRHWAVPLAKAWARNWSRSSPIRRVMSLRTIRAATPMALAMPFGVGVAVAFHDQAVQPEEHRAIVIIGVEVDFQHVQRGPRQSEAGLRPERAGEGAAKQVGDEARGALGGLRARYCPKNRR